MAAASSYLEKKLLDHTLGVASFGAVSAANLYMALFTANPGDGNNTAVEVSTSGTGYARELIVFSAATADTTGSHSVNSALVQFGPASASWGTVTHWGLYDGSTGGNLLYYSAVTSPATINNGNTYQFPSGTVEVKMD